MRSLLGSVLNRTPVSYAPRSRLSLPSIRRANNTAYLEAYGAVSTLFGIVNRTSSATGQVEWKLWRKAASGKKEDRTEVASHAALDLIQRPNGFMTREFFFEASQQHGDLTGEAWWVVGRDPRFNIPLELWPVRPDRIDPVPSSTDFIAGYIYSGPDGEKVPLGVRDVVMPIHMPNPMDPYRGMGPVQALLVDLEGWSEAAAWNRNFFRNSAEPGGVIETDRDLDDDEFDEFTDRWREQHQGVNNAHRVAVLERGMKWVERKYTMRDMEFSSLRNVTRDIIREAFGFPKGMLGLSDDVNRAVMEAQDAMFGRWLVVPRLRRIKGALNTQVLPLYGPGSDSLEFDFEDPVPPNGEAENAERDSKVQAAVALIGIGADPAETFEAFELPDLTVTKPEPPPALAGVGAPAGELPPPPPE